MVPLKRGISKFSSELIRCFLCVSIPMFLASCTKEEPPKEFVKVPSVEKNTRMEKKFVACKLARIVKKGDEIKKDDVDFVELKWSKVPYGTMYSSHGVINGIAVKDLEKDTIVNYRDLKELPVGACYMLAGKLKVVSGN